MININQLKKKLRKLKKLEIKIRFENIPIKNKKINLVWDMFFCTKNADSTDVKYCMDKLMKMSKQEYKNVIDEYFFNVYYQNYLDNGLTMTSMYDPHLLQLLNLPFDAELADIKKRFRELAKLYHPDRGGDEDKMIELLEIYNGLINKS
ncbi:J domain-containing protein [Abyssisolibacter fermentans]|uniref:J domain-containing protein n=1 Tax=Abyssisolibacter fermentans TaxID=1766203 RepID=UPI00082E733F|nr:DnaJ domain-containing protein [Abyssisolibacter fermentans]